MNAYNKNKPITIVNNKFKTYLIGSMEAPSKEDGGVGWRQQMTPELNKRGVYCFDPTREEIKKVGCSSAELVKKIKGWKRGGSWHHFIDAMSKIWKGVSYLTEGEEAQAVHILGDVDYVEHSDFLIWNYDEGDRLGGTIAELVIAWYRGIPVYLITKAKISEMNSSILYFLLSSGNQFGNKIFKSQKDFMKFFDQSYAKQIDW